MLVTIVLAILLIIIILMNTYNFTENYSSLDIYYPPSNKKPNPDICNECGGLCQYCNHGKNRPNTCNNPISFYKRGYLNPAKDKDGNLKVDPKAIASTNEYKCEDNAIMNSLISANYVYIYSNAFNKSLAFESYGAKSYVFVDPKMPNPKDDYCMVGKDYDEYCESDPNFDKHLPQKWRINIKSYLNPNQCLVTISSYSCNGLKYYLTAHQDGKVSVSLFGNDNNQVWSIYPKKQDDDNTDNTSDLEYLIKSHMYCTYLSATNQGYMRRNAGNVSLMNVNFKYIGKENIWNFMMCGSRKIDFGISKDGKYTPMNSTLDFPYVNDNLGPKDVVPKGIKLSDNVDKKWGGRNMWMPEFLSVWNTLEGNIFNYQVRLPQNFVCKIKDSDRKKIVTQYQTFNLCTNINIKSENYNQASGQITVYLLKTNKHNENVNAQLISNIGLDKNDIYSKYDYTLNKQTFNVKSSGANVLHGKGDNGNTIFAEIMGKKPIKMRITIRNANQKVLTNNEDIVLQKITKKDNTSCIINNEDIKFNKPIDC